MATTHSSLRRTLFRALKPLRSPSSSSSVVITRDSSILSIPNHSLEPSSASVDSTTNNNNPLITRSSFYNFRRFSSLTEEPHGPAAIDYRSMVQEDEYHRLANSTIHDLLEKLEEYGDSVDIDGFDVDYGNEVLTLRLGSLGTYVINKQTPNRQIWMSSPVSGPSRFDWDRNAQAWIYRRTKGELFNVLETELEKLCAEPNNSDITSIVVDSLHKGLNWKTLTEEFSSIELTNPTVHNVLLQLKEPIDSRKALTFFHWSAKQMHFQHGIFSYCTMINILVKAGLVKDAKALFESVLGKDFFFNGDSRVFVVLESLIDSYGAVKSVPFVFDLFVQTCAKLRVLEDVIGACKLLSDHGFSLSVTSFNALLHAMQKSDEGHLVWCVYEHMVYTRVCPDEVTVRIMVDAV